MNKLVKKNIITGTCLEDQDILKWVVRRLDPFRAILPKIGKTFKTFKLF